MSKLLTWVTMMWIAYLKHADSVQIPVGNPIIESSSTFDVVGNLFVIDRVQVPFNGTIYSITGFFLNTHPAILQVWRPIHANPHWDIKLVHEVEFQPTVSEQVQTIVLHEMDDPTCFVVAQGDVLGIFIKTIPSPVTYVQNFDNPNTLRKKFNSEQEYPVIGDEVTVDILNFPYQFSIYMSVDIGDIGKDNGEDCTGFYKRAEEYQASLPLITTTEAMNLTTPSLHGATGATGAMGPTGPKGDKGDQGPPGVNGIAGDTGAMGPQGFNGDTGATGEKGEQGVKGESGNRPGETGAPGMKGDRGDIGLPGSTGARGWDGATGEQGLPGAQGDTGLQGARGTGGIRGPEGLKGDIGATGAVGPQGPPGPISNSSKALPQAGASATEVESELGLLSDIVIIILLAWQTLTTILLLVCCGLYICRRKNKGFFTRNKVAATRADAYIVSNINSVTTENVTSVEGLGEGPSFRSSSRMQDKRKMETNVSWAFVKTAPKYKPNGLIGSTNEFYPQDYD